MLRLTSRASLLVSLSLMIGCSASTTSGSDAGSSGDAAQQDAATLDSGSDDGGSGEDAATSDAGSIDDAGAVECAAPSECALRAATCCGVCGSGVLADYVALLADETDAYGTMVCTAEGFPPCSFCEDPPGQGLVATCNAGECVAVDLREEPLAECAVASDCMLAPRVCCACGVIGTVDSIAYNPAHGSPDDYVCDDGLECPPCVPTFEGSADCVAGRCVVVEPT